jgi:hypothetical protein
MMNVFKIVLVLFTATGLGFGVDEVLNSNAEENVYLNAENNYDDYAIGLCHGNDAYFFDHMLEGLTDEEQLVVQTKIDELLIKYDISISHLNDDINLRYDFMIEFMEYLDESGIDYHNYYYDEDDYGNHMGMHR